MTKVNKLIKKNIEDCIYSNSITTISFLLLTVSVVAGIFYIYAMWYDWIVQTIWQKDINNWWYVLTAAALGKFKMETLIPIIFSLYILILL
jgi:hypothetical protein